MSSQTSGSPTKRRRIEKEYSISSSASKHPRNFYDNDEKERLRLLYVFGNISNETIANTLKEAVQKSDKKLPSLTTIFDKKKFPAKVYVMSTCTRCGREFDPNYNDEKSCKVLHPDWDCTGKSYNGYRWQCTSCDKEWETDGLDDIINSDPDIAFCYVGQHTIEEEPDTDTDSEHDRC